MVLDNEDDTDFVKFWNSVLEPKFTKYRHILQGGLSRHSAAVIPNLPIKEGMSVLDVGCGAGAFTAALKQADPTFTDAELRTLADSLIANRKAREAKAKAARDARAAQEAAKAKDARP